jgi:hypothetical protein
MRSVAFLLLSFAACAPPSGPAEELDRAVAAYNDHLRWARFDKASAFIKLPKRPRFMELYEPSEETLHIEDIEVKNVDLQGKKAKVVVQARFYKSPSVTLQKKRWVQLWQRDDDAWWVVSPPEDPFFTSASSQPSTQPWN